MDDPVIDREGGREGERDWIVRVLSSRALSPLTRNAMRVEDLFPNRSLRAAIEEWKLSHTVGAAEDPEVAALKTEIMGAWTQEDEMLVIDSVTRVDVKPALRERFMAYAQGVTISPRVSRHNHCCARRRQGGGKALGFSLTDSNSQRKTLAKAPNPNFVSVSPSSHQAALKKLQATEGRLSLPSRWSRKKSGR